ncbi:MAG: diadenylate cyclase [Candidatus Daviesbacteria bacterium]|nr:diadenylate cyclase [Candidatus Daviesbacteria bacterium]
MVDLSTIDLILAITVIVASLFYLKKFPVFRVVVGIFILFICSVIFLSIHFVFTGLIFGIASVFIAFSLPLIFAPEIRHYLDKLGRVHWLIIPKLSKKQADHIFIRNLVDGVYEMAEKKIGALIVLQRRTKLGNLIETGIKIDACLGSKILQTIFYPNSPLHDGAVVIVEGRIVSAKCIVQVLPEVKLDPPFGLRHRAGLSITKDTDAVSLIISEQRGEVTLAENGKFDLDIKKAELIDKLNILLAK